MDSIFLKPPAIDAAVWRPDVPLVVLERCDSKEQLSVWIAIRWLMAAFPHEKGFGTRKIALRAKVNQKYVARWCAELVDLELLSHAGDEPVAGFRQPRPIYSIPLRTLERLSVDMAIDVLLRWGAPLPPPSPSREQLRLDLVEVTEPLRDQSTDPSEVQSTDPLRDQSSATDPLRDQITEPLRDQTDPLGDQLTDPLRDHGREGGKDGRGEGSRTPPVRKKSRRRRRRNGESETPMEPPPPPPGSSPPPPAPPPGQPPLPAHPLALWSQACRDPRTIDPAQLDAFAAEYDASTGHGWYWVGRAILAAALKEDVREVTKVRTILDRWRDEDSYGSDLPSSKRGSHDERRRAGSVRSDHRSGDSGAPPQRRAAPGQRDDPAGPEPDDDVPAYLRSRNR